LQKEFGQVNKQLDKTHAQIEENEGQLTEILASELPDKDSKAAALSNEIIAIRASLADDAGRIPDLENEISKLEVEQQPFEDQISRLTEQILTVEKNQEEALVPLDQRIADLKEGIQSTKSEVDDLKEKMKPIIQSLGPLVESARPESEVLTELYLKIDAVRANLGALIQEHDIVTTRLETGDQDEARNFYIMAGGILILVILIVVLLIVALG
jgi:chromosome segregation ATPase